MSTPPFSQDEYSKTHAKRFELSLAWIKPFLSPLTSVLELGGRSEFSAMVERAGVSVCDHSSGDLRYPGTGPSDFYDLILCMEVLEHISDQESDTPTQWNGTGTSCLLAEAYRQLAPGGVLFLTTPNAASLTAISHALHHKPAMIYAPHVREYVPYQLDELVRAAGFEIDKRTTENVWLNAITPAAMNHILDLMDRMNCPVELRGEDIFLLAKKPTQSQ